MNTLPGGPALLVGGSNVPPSLHRASIFMSFTDGKQYTVDADNLAVYKRLKKRYACSLCGHKFELGDAVRWIYANGTKGAGTGNFFVCAACDLGTNDQIIERAKESLAHAVKLAKQWDIYGPDWLNDRWHNP